MQTTLTFETQSPINIERLSKQNRRLYDYLASGKKINCLSNEVKTLRIGYLNSRISDLRNVYEVPIQDRFIELRDVDGGKVHVKEYWINIY